MRSNDATMSTVSRTSMRARRSPDSVTNTSLGESTSGPVVSGALVDVAGVDAFVVDAVAVAGGGPVSVADATVLAGATVIVVRSSDGPVAPETASPDPHPASAPANKKPAATKTASRPTFALYVTTPGAPPHRRQSPNTQRRRSADLAHVVLRSRRWLHRERRPGTMRLCGGGGKR